MAVSINDIDVAEDPECKTICSASFISMAIT